MWLGRSGESILAIQQALDIGSSLGAPVDAASLDPLLAELVSMRDQMQQVTETVGEVRDRGAEIRGEGLAEDRIEQAIRLVLRVVATLAEVDECLSEYLTALDEIQPKLEQLNRKTNLSIFAAMFVALLLILWMAAGQVSLCRNGWKNLRRDRSAA
jgi:hypothetical protein